MGNPTTYRGKALTFTLCHLVSSFDGTAFVYDGDGNRVKKTPQEGTATEYFHADGTLYKEKFGVDTILYYRDEDGEICSFMLNYSPYILRKNVQGDVIALCDSNGAVVARYVYDAWGNHKVLNPDGTKNTSTGFIGNINPIRYRGYYYDKDLGLYWLKTRFYDPQTGRFISPDSVEYLDPETLGGINLYAYCNNNPVMNVDPNGTMPKWLKWVIGGAVIVGLGIATIATGGAAAGVAGFIVSGAKLIKETVDPLLGMTPGPELVETIRTRLLSYDGVLGIHDLSVHSYGAAQIYVFVHVEVDAKEDAMKSHDLVDNIERDFKKELGIHLSVHTDPILYGDEETDEYKAKVKQTLAVLNQKISIHDFRIVKGPTHVNLVFDVLVPYDVTESEEELCAALDKAFADEPLPCYFVFEIDRSAVL